MQPISLKTQVMSVTDTDGTITPLRVRFQNTLGEIVTYDKIKVLKRNDKALDASFLCSTIQYNKTIKFVICYNYSRHVWTIEIRGTEEEYNYILNS